MVMFLMSMSEIIDYLETALEGGSADDGDEDALLTKPSSTAKGANPNRIHAN